MQELIDYTSVPKVYSYCLYNKCHQADSCLRHLVVPRVPTDIQHWNIISLSFLESLKGACPHYRSSQKVRNAQGFVKLIGNLPHNQMLTVVPRLVGYFGRTAYYRKRKGTRLISPEEQQKILNILKECGVTSPQEFDKYVEGYRW